MILVQLDHPEGVMEVQALTERQKTKGESSSATNYLRENKDLSRDSFLFWNTIHEQSLDIEYFSFVDRFFEYL